MSIKKETGYLVLPVLFIGLTYTKFANSSECGEPTSDNIFTAISNFIELQKDSDRCEILKLNQEKNALDRQYYSANKSDSAFRSSRDSLLSQTYQTDLKGLSNKANIQTSIEPDATKIEIDTLKGYGSLK